MAWTKSGYSITELGEEELPRRAAEIIADGKILGCGFKGAARMGPARVGVIEASSPIRDVRK